MSAADDEVDVRQLVADLTRWAADSRTAEEAAARSRRAWLRRQAAEETSLEELLIGWAERGSSLRLATLAGTVHNGKVVLLGSDFVLLSGVGLATASRPRAVLVRRSAIASVSRELEPPEGWANGVGDAGRAPPGSPEPPRWSGQGPSPPSPALPGPSLDLAGALGGLAADRPRLRILAGPSISVVGELRWVGTDVACVGLDGPMRRTAYVPLASIHEVWVLAV